MQLLRYLHRNRERPRFGSARWWKVWAKRVMTSPHLIESVRRQSILRWRGARIETPVFIAPCLLNGKARNLEVGMLSVLGRAVFHLHDKIVIGRNVVINDGATLLTATHDVTDPHFRLIKKPIVVKDYAWIATGAIILPGVTVGSGAVIGAASVVTKDVPDCAIVGGNPAQLLSKRRSAVLDYQPARLVAAFEAWLGTEKATERS